ncbi:kinase-like protein [Rozella allomycis CSF55]|uniref:Kinase-like protein n=1 Tax=Rozella allomycis (strain CSF55) TaxID=988480 RepID=A0A4P9YJ55_ROZAC|nr:kinase-like protein [Rozella allomycis CSF55]
MNEEGTYYKKRTTSSSIKVKLQDFVFLAVLGKGNFGKVMLAEEKESQNLYAIKVLKKAFIIEHDEVESLRAEKKMFEIANKEHHPFLVNLHSCFHSETRVYFVMEYVNGGDLMLHIQRGAFTLSQAKFYAAEVLLALEYFHKNDIIYRDIKLDNILLCADGHIKVADYGLCKEGMGYGRTTNTFCGTPEFMAPEILLEQDYTKAVDWWSFGVLLYEMILGMAPFHGDSEDDIFDSILHEEVLYPINMDKNSVSIIQRLLTKEPKNRLGYSKKDAEELKSHPFFNDIDWKALYQKKVTPPFIPEISSKTDISNFDCEFTREMPCLTPVQTALTENDEEEFKGFSYVANWVESS